jgi:hypothetical protein
MEVEGGGYGLPPSPLLTKLGRGEAIKPRADTTHTHMNNKKVTVKIVAIGLGTDNYRVAAMKNIECFDTKWYGVSKDIRVGDKIEQKDICKLVNSANVDVNIFADGKVGGW